MLKDCHFKNIYVKSQVCNEKGRLSSAQDLCYTFKEENSITLSYFKWNDCRICCWWTIFIENFMCIVRKGVYFGLIIVILDLFKTNYLNLYFFNGLLFLFNFEFKFFNLYWYYSSRVSIFVKCCLCLSIHPNYFTNKHK